MDKLEYIPGDLVKFATNTYTIVNFDRVSSSVFQFLVSKTM